MRPEGGSGRFGSASASAQAGIASSATRPMYRNPIF